MKNKELFDRANADGDKELQAKLRNDFAEWCKKNGFRRSWHCPMFKDQITGKPMYDCAFQYLPWWEGCEK